MQNQLRTTELEEKTKMLTDQQDVIHAFIHVSPITPEPEPALQDHQPYCNKTIQMNRVA